MNPRYLTQEEDKSPFVPKTLDNLIVSGNKAPHGWRTLEEGSVILDCDIYYDPSFDGWMNASDEMILEEVGPDNLVLRHSYNFTDRMARIVIPGYEWQNLPQKEVPEEAMSFLASAKVFVKTQSYLRKKYGAGHSLSAKMPVLVPAGKIQTVEAQVEENLVKSASYGVW